MSDVYPPRAADLKWSADGLIPGVVQDARTGQVLMLAYLNRESYAATLGSGYVHFWSRSRQELWFKGATSGATLEVVTIRADCDADTLLITARPAGPACHRHTTTCFDDSPPGEGFQWLEHLWDVIASRAAQRPAGSYTTRLLEGGVDLTGRKLMEEATEVLMAARDHARGEADNRRVSEEMADLVYHLLVLAADRQIRPSEIVAVLEERFSS
ncbi:MAG: bifunctional phosphoribosyl-AMP cyclohydrolase/phosphoribosyl-ATP diphosphatase HisIE [bacterium]|nr:bifunctional phosphoribosyl-AMP cyclohydrolase/phosphoribosyl-ATP diphosphatase HisIE [bacterium]MDE0601297.1 bifunctional phosphoribosyl-AMP cyclohydrolase/phosphoribosyl-ATP diphosphatase HisIE [bacterium]